jgi:hypothetical protein
MNILRSHAPQKALDLSAKTHRLPHQYLKQVWSALFHPGYIREASRHIHSIVQKKTHWRNICSKNTKTLNQAMQTFTLRSNVVTGRWGFLHQRKTTFFWERVFDVCPAKEDIGAISLFQKSLEAFICPRQTIAGYPWQWGQRRPLTFSLSSLLQKVSS